MKKLMFLLAGGIILFLAGCQTTKEISIRPDGSGTVVSVTDMSGLIGMAKMSGKNDDLEKYGEKSIDTTVSLGDIADSIPDLTPEEKTLFSNGTIGFNMDVKNDKFIIRLEFPFTNMSQLKLVDKLIHQAGQEMLRDKMGEEGENDGLPPGLLGTGKEKGSADDYYVYTYTKGLIEKKLIRDKYATVADDKLMESVKKMSAMGVGNSTVIIKLPAPAKKAEGKNVELSDDKRTVTITENMEDFFQDGTSLEFRIEY